MAEKPTYKALEQKIAELERNEAYYRLIAENSTDMISKHTPDGVYTYASPACIALTGYDPVELIGRNAYDFFHHDDLEAARQSHLTIFEAPIVYTVPYRFRHKQGHYVWVETRSKTMHHPDSGRIEEIIAATRDISAQKQAQSQLEKSEERYKFLVENMGDVLWTLDQELKVTYVSPSMEKVLGYSPEERRHLPLKQKMTPDSYKRLMDSLSSGLKRIQRGDTSDRTGLIELEYYHKDGSTVWLENHAKVLRDNAGNVIGMYGVSRDITHRRKSELQQRLQAQIMSQIHDSVIAIDLDGLITYWNKGSERLFYYTEEEVLGRHIDFLYPEDYHERLRNDVLPTILARGSHELDTTLLRKGGHRFNAMVSLSLLQGTEGEPSGMIGYTQDITERIVAEQALRESETRFRVLFEQANISIFVHDMTGRFHMVNSKACKKLGYTQEELLDMTVAEIDPDFAARQDDRHIWSSLPLSFESRHRRKDGTAFPVEIRLSKIRFRDQDLVLAMVTDITENLKAKQALADSEQRLMDIIEFLPDPTWVIDIHGRVIAWNKALEKVTGIAKENILGKGDHAHSVPFYGEPRPTLIDLVLQGDSRWEGSYQTLSRKNGLLSGGSLVTNPVDNTIRYLEGTAAKLYDAQGNVVGAIETLRDTTDRKKMEEDLKRSNEELEQFAYAASHDLQEPLRAIVGFLQLLEKRSADSLDGKGKHYIERSILAGHRMQTLIRELLTLSRVTTKGDAFAQTDLNQLVCRLIDHLQLNEGERIVDITCGPLPVLTVDANQVSSLFQNLILNALKYNKNTPPKVAINCREAPHVSVFSVSDNGIGIAPKFHQRIFTVFQRLHTDQEYPGTGLGLALCKKIVERHGGTIWVKSEEGQGSTFYFTLPKRR